MDHFSHSQLARQCASRSRAGRRRLGRNPRGMRALAARHVSPKATLSRSLPAFVYQRQRCVEERSGRAGVHAGVARVGRNLEEAVCGKFFLNKMLLLSLLIYDQNLTGTRHLQVQLSAQSDVDPARVSSRIVGRHVDTGSDAWVAVESDIENRLGKPVCIMFKFIKKKMSISCKNQT